MPLGRIEAFPFRVGATSCTIEAGILTNVRALAPLVDDVEILVFCDSDGNRVPSKGEIQELARIGAGEGLSYTVHLPSSLGVTYMSDAWATQTEEELCRVLDATCVLQPAAYVWHWEAEIMGHNPSSEPQRWWDTVARVARYVTARAWCLPELLSVETLSYDFALIWPLVQELNLSVTLDIGHLWRFGHSASYWQEQVAQRARVTHVHGVDLVAGRDHLALREENFADLCDFCSRWARIFANQSESRVLTLEVFSLDDYTVSRSMLERAWATVATGKSRT